MKPILRLFAVLSLTYAGIVSALDVPGPLVDSNWLEQNLKNAVVLEVDKKLEKFKEGHIPGARFVGWKGVRGKQKAGDAEHIKMLVDAEAFNALMQKAGVNNGDAIVIASAGHSSDDMAFATRLYWSLKYYQYSNMAVLNGGVAQWVKDGKAVAEAPTDAKAGNFTASGENKALLTGTAQVKTMVDDGSAQLLDARTLDFYLGAAMKSYVFGKGHIPGAKFFPHTALVHWKAPTVFVDAELLASGLQAVGLDLDKPVVTYCNSGHLSSATWFVISELLGKPNVSIYDGSMHVWTKDKSLPLVTMKME